MGNTNCFHCAARSDQFQGQTWEREIHNQGPDSLAKTPLEKKARKKLKITFQIIPQATNLIQFLSGKPKAQLN